MRKTILLAALSLPLLAFDCGGDDSKPAPGGFACSLEIRGAVSEDLWCVATAYDYAGMPQMPSDMWVFLLVAYRGQPVPGGAQPEPAAEVGFYLVGPPALNQPYGWSEFASVVDSGSASRWEGSLQAGTSELTHEAMAPLFQGTPARVKSPRASPPSRRWARPAPRCSACTARSRARSPRSTARARR